MIAKPGKATRKGGFRKLVNWGIIGILHLITLARGAPGACKSRPAKITERRRRRNSRPAYAAQLPSDSRRAKHTPAWSSSVKTCADILLELPLRNSFLGRPRAFRRSRVASCRYRLGACHRSPEICRDRSKSDHASSGRLAAAPELVHLA